MELFVYEKCMSARATCALGSVAKSIDHLQKYCWCWEGLDDARMHQYGGRVCKCFCTKNYIKSSC